MDKKRIANLLGAGTITALILAVVLLFGGSAPGETAASGNSSQLVTQVVPLESYQQLQAENDQLRLAVEAMQVQVIQPQSPNGLANDLLAELGRSRNGFEYEEHENESASHFFIGDD